MKPAVRLVPVLLLLPGVHACRSAESERARLTSTNPLDQVTAAVWLAEAGDAEAVARLVALLDDDDRTVRLYAIQALERLCGRTYGYRFYEPPARRRAAMTRWQEALRRGEVRVHGRAVALESGGVEPDGGTGDQPPAGEPPVPRREP